MTFWLKTPNNIYKNWLNSHIDRIMFIVSKLEIKKGTIQVEHPVFEVNKTKSIGVSDANYSCIWFLNGGIINSYQ